MSRLTPKLVFSGTRGRPAFRISGVDWQRIETAYGHPLSETIRRKIRAATREYLDWAQFELTAGTNSQTVARVTAIKRAAHEFLESILRCPAKIGRDADYFARALICKHSELTWIDGRDGLQDLALKLERNISRGCDRALAELRRDEPSGFRRGEMWGRWVGQLTSILSKRQLPTQIRKDTDKRKGGAMPSAFVAFVRELQVCIPQDYRRSQARRPDFDANIALSTAIAKGRTVSGLKTSPIAAK
jgi:hypothetical protein